MNIIKYLKEKGIKETIEVIWKYKLESILENIINIFTKNRPLKNKIMIESHNDFDCNGGAFYNYLIENNYNEKYKIIWLIRKKHKGKLPKNVETVPLFGPSFKKAYHVCTSKFFTFDCENTNKIRKDQKMVYCSHGAGGLKNTKGKLKIPNEVDFILVQSKKYAPIQSKQWGLEPNDKRFVYIGFPSHDTFFINDKSELSKVTTNEYNKIILWMPTFRKGGGTNRNDSTKEQKLGIPLIDNLEEYEGLNVLLKNLNIFMIIKIHPKQDLSNLKVYDMSNIKVLTGEDLKKLNIDNYKLVKCADALISDYSGIAYDFLQLNRPIAYVFDDIDDYKLGFVVEDIHTLVAGKEIYNLKDFNSFIEDIANEKDEFAEKREKIRDYIYTYHDGKSCERLAKLLKL